MPRPTVVVTRPAGQSRQLTEALQAAGLDVLGFPLLAIGPAADAAPLHAALARLDQFALVVFVSPNAVAYAIDALAGVQGREVHQWPVDVPIAVVGPASLSALAERGLASPACRLIAPDGVRIAGTAAQAASAAQEGTQGVEGAEGVEVADAPRFDSEALWAQLDVAALAGREVLIVRGNGGRDWLAEKLVKAGAAVTAVEAYHRSLPVPGSMQWKAVRDGLKPGATPHAWLLTSSEAVRNLDTLARQYLTLHELAALRDVQCIAPHARIAEQAAVLGFTRVRRAAPGDEGLLAACLQWAGEVAQSDQAEAASPGRRAGASAHGAAVVSGGPDGSAVSGVAVPTAAVATTGSTGQPVSPTVHRSPEAAPSPAYPPASAPAGGQKTTPVPSATPRRTAPATPDMPTKDDRVTQDNSPASSPAVPPQAASPASPASPPSTASTATAGNPGGGGHGHGPGPAPAPRPAGRPNLWWFVMVVLLIALGAGFWWLQQRVDHLTQELARRQQSNDALVQESRVLTRSAQDTVKELQAKVGALASQVGEARDKQSALEQIYQDLMRNRDDWEVAEIQQMLTNAGQQLQLTGSVQVALAALQSADMRLARSDKPQYNQLRRAIARDIARMKAVPDTDLTGAAIKIDEAINQIDQLPLLSGERMLERTEAGDRRAAVAAPGASVPAATDAGTGNTVGRWFGRAWDTVRDELLSVIRIRRVDDSEALLLTGDQGWFLRENVKLRLLNARLALLSRNEAVFRNDLAAAQAMITRYFDTKSRRVQGVATLLKQAQAGAVSVQLPTMSESLGALRALKKE